MIEVLVLKGIYTLRAKLLGTQVCLAYLHQIKCNCKFLWHTYFLCYASLSVPLFKKPPQTESEKSQKWWFWGVPNY